MSTSDFSQRLREIKRACFPFVTRTLRGDRLRRYAFGGVLLGIFSVVFGLWISQGHGDFEQGMRHAVDLEDRQWERNQQEFRITAHDDFSFRRLEQERLRLEAARGEFTPEELRYGQVHNEVENAYRTLYAAVEQPTDRDDEARALQAEAKALLAKHPPLVDNPEFEYLDQTRDYNFNWYNESTRQRLRAIIDADLLPNVVRYTSPLTAMDTVRVIGFVGGGFVLCLMLVAAPLVCGAGIAQEVHENTLQPILGTRLRPVDIVLGLTSSGLALAGLLAGPSLLVMLLAAGIAGSLVNLPLLLLLLCSTSAALCLLSQLAGYGLGRRWATGLVGTLLTAILAGSGLLGAVVGMQLERDMEGLSSILPQVGPVHLLRELFVPHGQLDGTRLEWATIVMVVGVLGYAALAWVMGRALTRRVSGRTQASLTRVEGLLAAFAVTIMAVLAVPEYKPSDAVPLYFVTLSIAALPLQLILMGRVVTGDGPATLRRIPLTSLLLEFASYTAVHAVVILVAVGPEVGFAPFGALHLLWALGVLALLAVRAVAGPMGILASLWTGFCMVATGIELVQAGIFTQEATRNGTFGGTIEAPLLLFEASPVLGLIQLGLLIWIPISLLRTLRKESAGLD